MDIPLASKGLCPESSMAAGHFGSWRVRSTLYLAEGFLADLLRRSGCVSHVGCFFFLNKFLIYAVGWVSCLLPDSYDYILMASSILM